MPEEGRKSGPLPPYEGVDIKKAKLKNATEDAIYIQRYLKTTEHGRQETDKIDEVRKKTVMMKSWYEKHAADIAGMDEEQAAITRLIS